MANQTFTQYAKTEFLSGIDNLKKASKRYKKQVSLYKVVEIMLKDHKPSLDDFFKLMSFKGFREEYYKVNATYVYMNGHTGEGDALEIEDLTKAVEMYLDSIVENLHSDIDVSIFDDDDMEYQAELMEVNIFYIDDELIDKLLTLKNKKFEI